MPILVGNKHFYIHFLPHKLSLSIFRLKIYEPNPSEMDVKALIPAPTQKQLI